MLDVQPLYILEPPEELLEGASIAAISAQPIHTISLLGNEHLSPRCVAIC